MDPRFLARYNGQPGYVNEHGVFIFQETCCCCGAQRVLAPVKVGDDFTVLEKCDILAKKTGPLCPFSRDCTEQHHYPNCHLGKYETECVTLLLIEAAKVKTTKEKA